MKKFLVLLLAALVFLVAALGFYAPLRETARPYLPLVVQQFMPAAKNAGAADATAPRSGGKGAAIAVSIANAELATLPLLERTYGTVKSSAVVVINARVASQITEVHVKDGQSVKAGDLLVVLDDRLLQAQLAKDQAVLLKNQALEISSTADLSRAKNLVSKGAGTAQTYDQALAGQKAAEATVSADKAAIESDQAQIDFTKITAPIDGRLGAVEAFVGNLVNNGSSGNSTGSLMTITQMKPLKVNFQLPERVLPAVKEALQAGQTIPVRVLQSGTTKELESGNLDFIDSSVDTTSGTITMAATVDNDHLSLWPGQYVDVEVKRGQLVDAVVVPTVAVQQGQSGSFVWLVKDDNTVTARLVTVAHSESDKSAIAAGLAAGDKVVVEGQLRLKDGTPVKITSPQNTGGATDEAAPGDKKKKS